MFGKPAAINPNTELFTSSLLVSEFCSILKLIAVSLIQDLSQSNDHELMPWLKMGCVKPAVRLLIQEPGPVSDR